MGTLAITKGYSAGNILTEAHIDAFRTGLLTLFNTDKLSSVNFSTTLNLTSTKMTSALITSSDNSYIFFGSDNDAKMGLDSSKNLVFDTTATTTSIRINAGAYEFKVNSTATYVPNSVILNGGVGIMSLISQRIKKPVLEWFSTVSVSLSENDAGTTTIYFPKFVASVTETVSTSGKHRWASISNTANGYGTAHTGAALGGRRSGVSLTTNAWYYVYAVKLRAGSDYSASTNKYIIVYDSTAPTATNWSTNDTNYGEGNWVYLGLIRYGYGATGSSSEIIKFKYSNKGWCYLYGKGASGYAGLNLAYLTTDVDESASALYTIAAGTSGNVIPATIGHIKLSMVREKVSDWYIKDSNSLIIWRGGWQTSDSTLNHGHTVELPNVVGIAAFQVRKGTGAVARAVVLTGFTDGYMVQRRQGKGI